MTDLTPLLNESLKGREAPAARASFSREKLDDFLREAYQINAQIASLHQYLRSIRQAYLSTAPPPRSKTHLPTTRPGQKQQRLTYLTELDKEAVDGNAKQMLRELNAGIQTLSRAEQLRQQTAARVLQKKFGGRLGLGTLGAWAAGGGDGDGGGGLLGLGKTPAHREAEERAAGLSAHREGVLWFLRKRLEECAGAQQAMMDVRLTRDIERNRSVLAKAPRGLVPGASAGLGLGGAGPRSPASTGVGKDAAAARFAASAVAVEEETAGRPGQAFSDEQIQMFEKDNQDMLKHYESTLDQVRSAERSLTEISELQTQLVANLTTQSAHIDQLVADSVNTADNVGKGNKELKKASERRSMAQLTFYVGCGLSVFLIVWDLVI